MPPRRLDYPFDHHLPSHHAHRGYWAAFPSEEAVTLLETLFGNRDSARAAERILRDCPPEIAIVVEVIVRVWALSSNMTMNESADESK